MKNKNIIVLGIILVVAIVIAIVSMVIINNKKGNYLQEISEIIDIINNNSNLPIRYMSKYNNIDVELQKYLKLSDYMSNDFNDKDISFSYYGYPNDTSEFYLGRISLLSNKYNILGVTIGDDMKQAISTLEKYGFKLEERNNDFVATLKYKEFTIKIESDEESFEKNEDKVTIGMMQLEAKSEYTGERIY